MSQGKRMVDDLFLTNFLKLTLKFYSGQTQMRRAKRLRKKLISMALPPGIELVLAAGAVPVFLVRMGDYSSQPLLRIAQTFKNLVGWNQLSSGMRFLRPSRATGKRKARRCRQRPEKTGTASRLSCSFHKEK